MFLPWLLQNTICTLIVMLHHCLQATGVFVSLGIRSQYYLFWWGHLPHLEVGIYRHTVLKKVWLMKCEPLWHVMLTTLDPMNSCLRETCFSSASSQEPLFYHSSSTVAEDFHHHPLICYCLAFHLVCHKLQTYAVIWWILILLWVISLCRPILPMTTLTVLNWRSCSCTTWPSTG